MYKVRQTQALIKILLKLKITWIRFNQLFSNLHYRIIFRKYPIQTKYNLESQKWYEHQSEHKVHVMANLFIEKMKYFIQMTSRNPKYQKLSQSYVAVRKKYSG